MKIVLIHCYSDNNKGDLGIMLATIQLLREVAPNATIEAVSTFEKDDPFFKSEHQILMQNVDQLHPAVLGRAYSKHGKIGLLVKTVSDFPKLIAMYLPAWVPLRKWFLGRQGRATLDLISNADVVISKGGSFLCSEPGAISNLRLIRLMSTLSLALTANKNVFVWGQSIGPVSGRFTRKLLNSCLSRLRQIVVREDKCKAAYPYIEFPESTTAGGCDLAFSLKLPAAPPEGVFDPEKQYVGFTIKPYSNSDVDALYTSTILQAIDRCVHTHGKHVIIVPHVTIDQDQVKSAEIYGLLDAKTAPHVTLLNDVYDINELLGIYSNLELLIGTRLHSTIFSMSVETPAINISYHGTKSQGVYARMGLEHLVIETSDFGTPRLDQLIDEVLSAEELKSRILEQVRWVKTVNLDFAKNIVDSATK